MDMNILLNGGAALGGGLGAMPVALPYTAGGAVPGIFGAALPQDMRNKMLGMGAGILGGAGVGAGVLGAMQNKGVSENPQQPQAQPQEQPQQQNWGNLGMNTDAMQAARMLPNQYLGSTQEAMDKMAVQDQSKSGMEAMKMMGQGMRNMGGAMKMPMPSPNTAQIMRDQNQFRFAGTPQQQMAQALRRR